MWFGSKIVFKYITQNRRNRNRSVIMLLKYQDFKIFGLTYLFKVSEKTPVAKETFTLLVSVLTMCLQYILIRYIDTPLISSDLVEWRFLPTNRFLPDV